MNSGWPSGPRPPGIPTSAECWRCAAEGQRGRNGRKLRPVGLVVEGHNIGSVLLCGPCIETRRPLNPDPLHVGAA